jgi:hypothetical protein
MHKFHLNSIVFINQSINLSINIQLLHITIILKIFKSMINKKILEIKIIKSKLKVIVLKYMQMKILKEEININWKIKIKNNLSNK